jgi:proteasome lid subunit RPN8/RPN11
MIIERNVADYIIAHAEQDAPIEACGYLLGMRDRITRCHPMTNAEGREDHFSFVPQEQFAAYKTARQEGLEIIGAYHSHPATPARPSAEDIRFLIDPKLIYIIVSLLDGKKIVKGFRIRDGKVEEEQLIIKENVT